MKERRMTHYAITKGEYSDYHIIAITSDKETAQAIADRFSTYDDVANVEEYEDGKFLMGGLIYMVWADKNGLRGVEIAEADYHVGEIGSVSAASYLSDTLITFVVADSEEKAAKIGKDRIMKFIAGKEGI